MAVSRVKYLTGMGQIKARYLNENPFTFKPCHKVFLDCNYRPVIRNPNDAIWNRIKTIPFDVTIPPEEIDTNLPAKLIEERQGILAWVVRGAVMYMADGLKFPEGVVSATESYRGESDHFADFIADACVTSNDPNCWVPVANLWQEYVSWAEGNGEDPLMKTAFDERIRQIGCQPGRKYDGGKLKRVWVGLRFRTARDEQKAA